MATVPASAYIGKIVFKKGSAVRNHYVAKFIFGTRENGGYYDTGGTATITNATTIAAIRQALIREFEVDDVYIVAQGDTGKGFVGLVKEGGTLAGYHNMSKRAGHKMQKNGVTYIALNDGGLHVIGDGNVNFSYLFDNMADGLAVLTAPIYDKCTYTFQYSADGGTTWYTYQGLSSRQVAAKTQANVGIGTLTNISGQGSSSAQLTWRLVCTNDEGTRTLQITQALKPTAYMCQSEYFSSLNSNTYSGNGTGRSLYMYKADFDAITWACANQTLPPGGSGITPWSRGDKRTVSAVGLSSRIYVYASWAKLYAGGSDNAYRGNAGYYLLTKNYGIQINTYGYITYVFYAYSAAGTNPTIRITASFWRGDLDTETGLYQLTATVIGEYVNATPSSPSYDTDVTVSCQFSNYNDGPAGVGVTIIGESAANYKEDTLTVYAGGSVGSPILFRGYTDNPDIQGVRIRVTSTPPLPYAVVYG